MTSYIITSEGDRYIVLADARGIIQSIPFNSKFNHLFNEENEWEIDWTAPLPRACSLAPLEGLSAHQVHDELFPDIDLELIYGLIELFGAFYGGFCDKAEDSMY